MQALRFQTEGEPTDVLSLDTIDAPEPGDGQLLVRMLASPVNPSDLMFIRGRYTTKASCPATPGFEGVGIVQHGKGLRARLFRGKRVVVINGSGGNWAELAVVPSHQVIPVSGRLSDEQAATFFVNPGTAWVMTQEVLKLPRGAWLVQSAAGSSLGRMIVRLGKVCGYRTFNLVRREEAAEELKALGADHVEVLNNADPQALEAQLKSAVSARIGMSGIRYAIDAVGGSTGSAIVRQLGPGGRMLAYGTLSNEPLQFSPRTLMSTGSSVEGFWLGHFMAGKGLAWKLGLVRRLTRLITSGVLATEIRQSLPLSGFRQAMQAAEDSRVQGKTLLRIQ